MTDLTMFEEEAPEAILIELVESFAPTPAPDEVPRRLARALSTNFKLGEFDCRDGTPVPGNAIGAVERLVKVALQPMRDRWGVCRVASGYRHREYNRRIGGAAQSRHIYDDRPSVAAADVIFASGTPRDWAAHAAQLLGPKSGIGVYRTFVHLDNDPSATRRW